MLNTIAPVEPLLPPDVRRDKVPLVAPELEPVVIVTSPPMEAAAVVLPAVILTAPPAPKFPSPTDRVMAPPAPDVPVPDAR